MLVKAQVPLPQLQKSLPAPVERFGEQLAQKILAEVNARQLGYVPALDYFQQLIQQPQHSQQQTTIEPFMLAAAAQIAEITIAYTKREVLNVLAPVFSSVHIETIQVTAFTLPPVRPGSPAALTDLAKHLTPDTAKFELQLTVIQKQAGDDGVEQGVARIARRWLSDKFSDLELTAIRLIS